MLFNSYEFIFLFLPISLVIFFIINNLRLTLASKIWLVAASIFFYSYWNIKYLPLLLISIIINFTIGRIVSKEIVFNKKRLYFIIGVMFNLLLLGYFKYIDFLLSNLNIITNTNINLLNVTIPLGISFFTFTQIAYLVDAYKSKVKEYDLVNYSLFVTFFPHLLAGPIIHHKEMMPQFNKIKNKIFQYKNVSRGLFLFSIGLFKKVAIADSLAVIANYGFDISSKLTFFEAWITSFSYTFQIYFDFSGYTDMALGCSLMFNIVLPINFNSPYKAINIQDFWRRWHITLSRFLRDYIYIPLGGNRLSDLRTLDNLMMTFLIGGLWHGAGWTFIFWGFLHGTAMVVQRIWSKLNLSMPKMLAYFITFNFVNIAWIFFRAKNWSDAFKIIKGMVGVNGVNLPTYFADKLGTIKQFIMISDSFLPNIPIESSVRIIMIIFISAIMVFFTKNSNERLSNFIPNGRTALFLGFINVCSLTGLALGKASEFIYFNF